MIRTDGQLASDLCDSAHLVRLVLGENFGNTVAAGGARLRALLCSPAAADGDLPGLSAERRAEIIRHLRREYEDRVNLVALSRRARV